ncbi:MAG: hypothetical protein NC548_62090 [Lachnospiraceae bacterium]|nr:hypothetical protein [Lachnospiraceae bacterium]
MEKKGFKIKSNSHERQARKLLLQNGLKTSSDLAIMSKSDVEQAINESYEAIENKKNWLLINREQLSEFDAIVKIITSTD